MVPWTRAGAAPRLLPLPSRRRTEAASHERGRERENHKHTHTHTHTHTCNVYYALISATEAAYVAAQHSELATHSQKSAN